MAFDINKHPRNPKTKQIAWMNKTYSNNGRILGPPNVETSRLNWVDHTVQVPFEYYSRIQLTCRGNPDPLITCSARDTILQPTRMPTYLHPEDGYTPDTIVGVPGPWTKPVNQPDCRASLAHYGRSHPMYFNIGVGRLK